MKMDDLISIWIVAFCVAAFLYVNLSRLAKLETSIANRLIQQNVIIMKKLNVNEHIIAWSVTNCDENATYSFKGMEKLDNEH